MEKYTETFEKMLDDMVTDVNPLIQKGVGFIKKHKKLLATVGIGFFIFKYLTEENNS